MKGGLVVMVQGLRAMKAAGVLKNADITIVLTGDEERRPPALRHGGVRVRRRPTASVRTATGRW